MWAPVVTAYVVLLAAAIAVPSGRTSADASGPVTADMLLIYWAQSAALWLLLSVMAWLLWTAPRGASAWRPRTSMLLILGVAVVARVCVVFSTFPQLSDDLWRYIHDGMTLGVEADNPYRLSPQEAGAGDQINHPQLVTIYQPTSQYVFAAFARLAQFFRGGPDVAGGSAHRVFRLGFVLFDTWIIALLMLKLLREGRPVWWAVLYAWHPLAISEVAASGHQDVIGIAWLLMTLALLDARDLFPNDRWPRLRALLAGGAFALALAAKPVVAPLLLAFAWSGRRRPAMLALAASAAALTLAALYVPFTLMDGGLAGMWQTIRVFVGTWAFNSALHTPLAEWLDSRTTTSALMTAVLAVILLFCMARGLDLWRTTMVYLFAALLLSSTAWPWYLLWALALVPLRFSGSVWLFSLTITWSYAAMRSPTFCLPGWVMAIEYLPVFAVVIWQVTNWLVKSRRSGS